MNTIEKTYAKTFSEVTEEGDLSWCEGMISGNGEQGVIVAGSPYSDTLIFQNINFIMPSDQPRNTPSEVSGQLQEARQAVVNFDDTWNIYDRKRTFLYCFHPSHQLRISSAKKIFQDYIRWTNYKTAEVGVLYTDVEGTWERKTFASRADNVVISYMYQSTMGHKISTSISIDDIKTIRGYGRGAEVGLNVAVEVSEDARRILQYAKYPIYDGSELNGGGYCGITYVVSDGLQQVSGKMIRVHDASYVALITKSDRSFDLNSDNIYERLCSDIENVILKYTEANGRFNYDKAIHESSIIHDEMYKQVYFKLGEDYKKVVYNEDIILSQKGKSELSNDLVERVYAQGRYAMICCAGKTMSRLCGMWTGEFNSGWNGIYTMDANVNLQSSSMNIGNMIEFGKGYINFVLKQVTDWKENAKLVYGMDEAILVPVNFDGNRAIMVEYDWIFPFQYWNAGASWILQPLYEMYLCFGNVQIDTYQGKKTLLDDILTPLLILQSNFWEQLVTCEYYLDASGNVKYKKGKRQLEKGEKYLIIPSYSPENNPLGRSSRMTANASMDIGAAKDGIRMTINILNKIAPDDYSETINRLKQLLLDLPDYLFDKSNALMEWSANNYKDNHEHRHISHLYCAWPAFEVQNNPQLKQACIQAIINRNSGNDGHDDFSGHGWLHKALVFARLKNGSSLNDMLLRLFDSDIFYTSLMADHNTTGKFVYCTDFTLGFIGIVDEALIYSDESTLEFLPAIPSSWNKGSAGGFRTRCGIVVNELTWDLELEKIDCTVTSIQDVEVKLVCRGGVIQEKYGLKTNSQYKMTINMANKSLEVIYEESI